MIASTLWCPVFGDQLRQAGDRDAK